MELAFEVHCLLVKLLLKHGDNLVDPKPITTRSGRAASSGLNAPCSI